MCPQFLKNESRLIGVYDESSLSSSVLPSGTPSGTPCLGRRQLPLTVEHNLTLILALDEGGCLACTAKQAGVELNSGGGGGGGGSVEKGENAFYRKYNCLSKDEMSTSLIVSLDSITETMGQEISCVGCRRSVEILHQKLHELSRSPSAKVASLEPLIITPEGHVSVNRNHLLAPNALANLFGHQIARLTESVTDLHHNKKSNGRCVAHSLMMKKVTSTELWKDSWNIMEPACREAIMTIPVFSLRVTLDRYLKKHSFCGECSAMVNKAFGYLVEYGVEPSKAANVVKGPNSNSCQGREVLVKKDKGNNNENNLYYGISVCTSSKKPQRFPQRKVHEDESCDQHVHMEVTEDFVQKLMALAEPELTGLRQERHARTIEIAQREILTCIGITLFERFQRLQQKLLEGRRSCDLLVLMSLKTLKRSFDMMFEQKQGLSDLEKLCQELDEQDKKKQEKAQKKRCKKKNAATKKKSAKNLAAAAATEITNASSANHNNNNNSSLPLNVEKENKDNNNVNERDRFISILSLDKMLSDDNEDDENVGIPVEDVQKFKDQNSDVNKQRAQIRQNLRQRFAQMCKVNIGGVNKRQNLG